jgi:single-strand DNA-binding protein
MSKSINNVQLLGNLGKDPEVRYTPQGKPVAKVSLATNERFKTKAGEWQDRTEWHNLVLWARLAEIAGEYLKKGSKIFVEGRLQTRTWEDKQNKGVRHYMTEIIVGNLVMLDGTKRKPAPQDEDAGHPDDGALDATMSGGPITDEDIPF